MEEFEEDGLSTEQGQKKKHAKEGRKNNQPEIERILKEYILRKITKEEIGVQLKENRISPKEFNRFIQEILHRARVSTKQEAKGVIYDKALHRETLRIKDALTEQQLQEIKKTLETSKYLTKPYHQYSFFRRTSEDLSVAVNTRPQLISLFSASYNVLCSKTQKVLSIKDLQNKLKKGSFEYKLNENVQVEIAQCMHECLKHYIKSIVERTLNSHSMIDKSALSRIMFGNVRGVYLLYEDYPLGK